MLDLHVNYSSLEVVLFRFTVSLNHIPYAWSYITIMKENKDLRMFKSHTNNNEQ